MRILKISAGLLAGLILIFFILNFILPLPEPYAGKDFARAVLDADGKPLRYFADSKGEWRYQASLSEVSPIYLEALVGYEDRFFYYHPGVNPVAVTRAAWQYAKNRRIISGGSTITMQVARIIDPHERNLPGKIRQAFRALQLEWKYEKNEILEFYLNLAPMGGNIQGVAAASYAYFDRPPDELNHTEAALLAVLPQAPSRLRPDRHPDEATAAKNKVAARMQEHGYWDNATVAEILQERVFTITTPRPMTAPLLAERLTEIYPAEKTIRTYVDRDLQNFLESLLTRMDNAPGVSAAVLVVDNSSRVIGYAGSMEYGNLENYGYIDMVKSVRSPGSAMKPFIYAMALDQGLIHSESLLIDAPRIFSSYQAGNFYQTFSGPVSAADSLRRSLNVPALQLLEHVDPYYYYAGIHNAGAKLRMLGGKPNLAMALGGNGIRLDELAMLYTAFQKGGLVTPLRYADLDGEENPRRLFSAEAAYIVYDILKNQYRQDHIFNVELTGLVNRLAWKTGTSYGFRDAISVGFTGDYLIAVWVGRPDNVPSPGSYGAVTAAPLVFSISDWLDARHGTPKDIERPEKVKTAFICWPSGLSKDDVAESDCHRTFEALTINGATPATLPETPDSSQSYIMNWLVTSAGKRANMNCSDETLTPQKAHVWPRLVEPWINARLRRSAILPPWEDVCRPEGVLTQGAMIISGVQNNNTIKSASVSGEMPEIPLRALGGVGNIEWYLNGLHIGSTYAGSTTNYRLNATGRHQLMAVDQELNSAVITFYVD